MNWAWWAKVGGIVGIVGAIAALIALVSSGNDGSQSPGSTGTPGIAQAPTATSTILGPAPAAPAIKPHLEAEVTLPDRSAVDIDKSGQLLQHGQDGATGPFDLYYDGSFYASGDIYMYPMGESSLSAFDKCAEYIDTHATTVPYVSAVLKGVAWCFTTSEGRLGWTQIIAKTNTSATVKVRVWDK